jgi:hypothetical protein
MILTLSGLRRSGLVVLALGCLFLSTGCGPVSSGLGGSATIGDTWVDYASKDGKLFFVLWNTIGYTTSGSSGGGRDGYLASGSIIHDKKPPLKWQVQTPDYKTGTVTINGTNYELNKGGLFLVSGGGEKATVRQFPTDLSAVEPSAKGLENFAKSDPDVAKFVASAAKRK